MFELSIVETLIVIFAAFCIGFTKSGISGLGIIAVPVMAAVFPAKESTGILLPILIFADIFAVALHWKRWDRRLVLRLIPGAVVGITLGMLFITNAPTGALRTFLGIIVLAFPAYKLLENRILAAIKYEGRSWHGLLAGSV